MIVKFTTLLIFQIYLFSCDCNYSIWYKPLMIKKITLQHSNGRKAKEHPAWNNFYIFQFNTLSFFAQLFVSIFASLHHLDMSYLLINQFNITMTCCKQFTWNYDLRPLICNTFVLEIATLVSKKKCPLYSLWDVYTYLCL